MRCVFGCTEVCRSVYLLSLPSTSAFGSLTLSLVGDTVHRTGRDTSGATGHCVSCWVVLEEKFLPKREMQCSSFHSFSFKLFESFSCLSSLICRKGLRHHICASEVSHQSARELCDLQTHQGRWPVGALPVLQWLL